MAYGPARVLAERASEVLTWKQFGAVGDGVADDTPAINACMAAAKAAGLEVHASSPDVGYRITAPIDIYDGTILRGASKVRTRIFCERTNGINCADSADDLTGLTSDWEIRNLLFVGDDDVATDGADHIGLHIRRSARFLVDSCEARGFTDACVVDGRKNAAGSSYGVADGRVLNSTFQTDNSAQQQNATNAYPRYLVEVRAEPDGVGGADGVSFYNCRLYAEILADTKTFDGDGVATSYPFGVIKAGKQLTQDDHLSVEYAASAGVTPARLTVDQDYAVDRTDPTNPVVEFTGGAAPLGAPSAVNLLDTTGDGARKAYRLAALPSFADADSSRAVAAAVDATPAIPGDDYWIVNGTNRAYAFTADAAADTLTIDPIYIDALAVGRIVRVASAGTLPAGLSAGVDYFATAIDTGSGAFKLAASYAAAVAGTPTPTDLTSAGSGVHTVTLQHAIEFTAAPANAATIVVDDMNLRARWIDPNAAACARLTLGAQRVSFFSCVFGGGRYGVDFGDARRCLIADAYFQIVEHALRFGPGARENQVLGFSARTDASILGAFAIDESATGSNAFNEYLAEGATAYETLYLTEGYAEDQADFGRLRKLAGVVSLSALQADGAVQLRAGDNPCFDFSIAADRTSIFDANGVERWRNDAVGALMPRTAGQKVGNTSFPVGAFVGEILQLEDGVASPSAVSGFAQLYVDTSDGALKVTFADGVTKTIATNP